MSLDRRRRIIEPDHPGLSIARQCELVSISRSGFYSRPAGETPLNLAHLRNMVAFTEMGAIVYPPLPAFYQRAETIAEQVDHTCGRVLDLLGIDQRLSPSWQGISAQRHPDPGSTPR